jgi:hypothetical protein
MINNPGEVGFLTRHFPRYVKGECLTFDEEVKKLSEQMQWMVQMSKKVEEETGVKATFKVITDTEARKLGIME